jgi:phosphoribosylanthranilate isomerase
VSLFVKICGVRTVEDALACAAAGVDAIGFNLWPGSKRYLPLEEAQAIARALPPSVQRWGVFVDPTADEVERALASGAVAVAQLHGDESPELCARFAGRAVKAVRLVDESSLAALDRYGASLRGSPAPGSPLLLVDADAPGYGGSGRRADLDLARRAAAAHRVLLAGGLTPDNLAEAVRAVRPFGVDVAGGVERAPGVKDPQRIAAFVAAARALA